MACRVRRCPTKDRSSSRSTSVPAMTVLASCWASPTRERSTRCLRPSGATARCPASRRCSGTPRSNPSTTSITAGARRNSHRAARRQRCRRARGRPTGRGCANPSTASIGPERKPPTSGQVSSTAPSGQDGARPTRWTGSCRLGADLSLLADRVDQPAQMLVDRVGALQDRAVAAGQFDELREIRHLFGDSA